MSSIIRITDIGRPGQLLYMNSFTDVDYINNYREAVFNSNVYSTISTSYVKVASGSFTIPQKIWSISSTSLPFVFRVRYSLWSGSSSYQASGYLVLDGYQFPADSTTSTTAVQFTRYTRKTPSSTTINWEFWLKTQSASSVASVSRINILYTPTYDSPILYARNLGTNALLTRAMVLPNTGLVIDDDYAFLNTSTSIVTINFDKLPFNKINFFGEKWILLEYLRVE